MEAKKNITKHQINLTLTMLFTSSFILYGQGEKKYIREGNTKYQDGKYPESEVSYRKSIEKNKLVPDAGFNLGDALYKQKKYEDAGKQFTDNSNIVADSRKKSNSLYNLGNALLNNNKIKESIEAYKSSLKLYPENREAKYNLGYAQDLLKLQQQQQNQQNKDQDKKDNKDNKKDDQNNDQDKKQNDNKDQKQDQQQQKQQQQQQGISKEDAQRLLDAIANDDKNVQEKVNLDKAAKAKVRTVLNW